MEKIINSILNGRCILFTGADFSKEKNTKNTLNEEFLRGGDLAKELLKECNEEYDDDLLYASEIYIEKKSKLELINFLNTHFKCNEISELHNQYSQLPWKNIYTTNYDNILEKSNPNLRPLTINSNIKMHTYKNPFVLYINGYIENLNEDSFNNDFKLTNTSYLIDEFNNSEWKEIFINDIKTSDYLIFIGYSLSDFDIAKILFQDPYLQNKIIFITSTREDKKRDFKLKKFGKVYNIGKEDFLYQINLKKENFIPEKYNITFNSFEHLSEINFKDIKVTDEDVFQFLMYGKNNDNLIQKSLIHNLPCTVKSETIDRIIFDLKENIVGLFSDMGNGKTVMVELIKAKLLMEGYEIFSFIEKRSTFDEELSVISKHEKKHLIVIENYHNYFDILKQINLKMNSNSLILITERTIFDELYEKNIQNIFSKNYVSYDLNNLPDEEIKSLISLFNLYGFSSYLREKGPYKKQVKYLTENLNRSMFHILLNLMESPNMRTKFEYLYEDLRNKLEKSPKSHEAFIALLILSVLGHQYNILDFYDLLGNDVYLQNDFLRDENILQLVNQDNHQISIKSSVLSNYILQNFIKDTKLILKILLKIIINALKYNKHKDLARELVNFSVLERILPKDKRDELINFYEETKQHKFFSQNAHFWLQYAITMISLRKFEQAKTYFNNAYSLSNSSHKIIDTTKIDNHYARFLLDRNIFGDINYDYMEDFKEAHKKLSQQISSKSTYFFPFKVASNYERFYEKFYKVISTKENQIFIKSAINEIINLIESMPEEDNLRKNFFVKDCLKKLLQVQKSWL